MTTYNILSLDGGGLRGIISATILKRISDTVPGFLDRTRLIAGTSTGGIIALGLAAGLDPQQLIDLYVKKGPKIFQDTVWDDIRDLGKTIGADYSNRNLKKTVKDLFGDTRLSQLNTKVTITSFDLDNEAKSKNKRSWTPKIFHNFKGSDSDGALLARNVAIYTSAAPTYFPSANGYIDGGVIANNPAMIALVQALDQRNRPDERAQLSNIRLLSIGTGVSLTYIKGKNLDWGLTQWAKPLISIMMDGVTGVADFQCRQLLQQNYHRIQPIFKPSETIPLDSIKKIPRMIEIANEFPLKKTINWLNQVW